MADLENKISEMSDEELLDEFATESWAADRCVGELEHKTSSDNLLRLRTELLRRMA